MYIKQVLHTTTASSRAAFRRVEQVSGCRSKTLRIHPHYSILPRELRRNNLRKSTRKYPRNPRGLMLKISDAAGGGLLYVRASSLRE